MSEAADIGPDELRVGMSAEFSREITQVDVDGFASNSGDRNGESIVLSGGQP